MKNKYFLLIITFLCFFSFKSNALAHLNGAYYCSTNSFDYFSNNMETFNKIKESIVTDMPNYGYIIEFVYNDLNSLNVSFFSSQYVGIDLYLRNTDITNSYFNKFLYLVDSNTTRITALIKRKYTYDSTTNIITYSSDSNVTINYFHEYKVYNNNLFYCDNFLDTNLNIYLDLDNAFTTYYYYPFTINYTSTSNFDVLYSYTYNNLSKLKTNLEIYNLNSNPFQSEQDSITNFYSIIFDKLEVLINNITENYIYLFVFSIPLIISVFLIFYKLIRK